jgi:hypothetical protein
VARRNKKEKKKYIVCITFIYIATMSGQFFPGSCGDLNPAVVVVYVSYVEEGGFALFNYLLVESISRWSTWSERVVCARLLRAAVVLDLCLFGGRKIACA